MASAQVGAGAAVVVVVVAAGGVDVVGVVGADACVQVAYWYCGEPESAPSMQVRTSEVKEQLKSEGTDRVE